MVNFFQGITQKIALTLAISLAGVAGLACQTQPATTTPTSAAAAPQTAIILSALVPIQSMTSTSPNAPTSSTLTIATDTPAGTAGVVPNLLPLVVLPPFPMSTTTQLSMATTTIPIKKPIVVKTSATIQVPVKKAPSAATAPTSTLPLAPITAQSILNGTTISLNQGLNGLDRLTFTTDLGAAGSFSWGLLDATVGGTGVIPKFDVSSSCTPPPGQADPNDPNQNPLFQVRTAYDCTVSVTPLSGSDMRTMSKDFTFTTPPGQLFVSVAPDTDVLLQNNTNNGGYTFNNEDSQPITITGLTVDVSFTGVKPSNLFVLRFASPADGSSLYDYPLENSPATGVPIPISLTIPANTQKVLPVEAIGVYILEVDGTSPAVTVTLRGVTTDEGNVKTQIVSPQISWSCVVPTVAYDPYATSSPFLSGDVCGN